MTDANERATRLGSNARHMALKHQLTDSLPLFTGGTPSPRPPTNDEVFARLVLLLLPQVGNYTASQWVDRYGSATESLAMIRDQTLSLAAWRIQGATVDDLLMRTYDKASAIVRSCVDHKIQLIVSESPLFPQPLGQLPSAPLVLFAKGDMNLLKREHPRICFFGKRKCTPFGLRAVQSIVQHICEYNFGVIGSLGTECGVQAAYTAIRSGRRPLVISPTPFDHLFKAGHRNVANYVLDHGGLILTDQIPGDMCGSYYKLLTQVRLQLASSDGLMLTESDPPSGTSFAVLVSRQLELPIFVTHPVDTYAKANPELIRLIRDDKTVISILSRDELYKITNYYQKRRPADGASPRSGLAPADVSQVLAWT